MDDRINSDFDPLPLQPKTPHTQPPDPPTATRTAVGSRGPEHEQPGLGIDLGRLVRFLYSHNPFYCISALLVLWGLEKSFYFRGAESRPELLMSGMAGYALLLAGVGCLLIRAGQLWEDTRTILLLIVIIFLASSMSFDEFLAADQSNSRSYFLGGLASAVAVSELVLRAIRLRLPMLYRLPYYFTLSLFFLYPLLLAPWQGLENAPQLRWRIAGFAPLAGLVTLTLLPAVRRGAIYVRDNGSPWQWPWYPWPLFVVLALGVGLRTCTLCIAFHPSKGPATIFEPYLLVPFLLAVNVVLWEIGFHSRRPTLLNAMMAAPLGLLLLASWTFADVPAWIGLRPMLLQACGCSPLYLTLVVVAMLYGMAFVRRAPHAVHWLTLAVALFIVIGPTTANLWEVKSLHAWPLVALGAVQLAAAVYNQNVLHWALTATCAIAGLCIAWPGIIVTRWHGAIPAHMALVSMLLIGAALRDELAMFLQRTGFALSVLAALFVLSGQADDWSIESPQVLLFYPGFMFLLAAAYAYWLGNRLYGGVAVMILIGWVMALGRRGYGTVRLTVAGLDEIAWGMACLSVGLTLSLWKIGMLQKWWQRIASNRSKAKPRRVRGTPTA